MGETSPILFVTNLLEFIQVFKECIRIKVSEFGGY